MRVPSTPQGGGCRNHRSRGGRREPDTGGRSRAAWARFARMTPLPSHVHLKSEVLEVPVRYRDGLSARQSALLNGWLLRETPSPHTESLVSAYYLLNFPDLCFMKIKALTMQTSCIVYRKQLTSSISECVFYHYPLNTTTTWFEMWKSTSFRDCG